MKQNWGTSFVKTLKSQGWVEINGELVRENKFTKKHSNERKASQEKFTKRKTLTNKTGWIDDSRNIKNKEKYNDAFIRFVEMELGLDIWPEFHFSIERNYRLDYAIPEFKIAIEVDGGIWMKGNSGHSSGTGIKRDMEKGNLLQLQGWKLLRFEPNQLISNSTIKSIQALT